MALVEETAIRKVPLVSMCGTDSFHGDYCFRLGNGDVGGDPSLIANWLKRNGHTRVAVLAPWTPISEEYFRYFRQECRRYGISMAAVETTNALISVDELADKFRVLRAADADALVWLGYGGMVVNNTVRRALDADRLGPAPHHDHRVHAVHLGLRPARGLGRHRPVVPGQPADAPLPPPLRGALRRGPVDVAQRHPRPRLRHGRRPWSRPSAGRRSSPVPA